MMRTPLPWLLALVVALAFGPAPVQAEDDGTVPDFELADTNGTKHKLSDFRGKWVVLEWVNYDCPFVKKHYDPSQSNMQTLQATYTAKGVVWLSILSSAPGKQGYLNAEDATKRVAKEGAKPTALLLDPTGDVGRKLGAKVTPDMRIVSPKGKLVYAGAIDSVRSKDPEDIPEAENYIAQVLDAVLAGQEPPLSAMRPYG